MKILVLYRPNSEHARGVESFLHDLQKQHYIQPRNLKTLNMDSREGISTASIYDIMAFPAILVTADNGQYMKHWEGNLPLMSEVMSYTLV
ncbi:hypothetical protein KDA06_04390 [Candidatus Saccharibacteria bacterium]|jgi:hypothetical protein|nr:hypothetical protein [Candidatus Saccharibacteria bacterium]HPR09727.1 hypothetical protein [Candidatus Saccharibacteria bacterium]